ncbi:sulfate adenylyltransferase subunit 2 [Burkholderia pseudomallei]|nr:sulfate adenylyltransferase subunit 2 [Burkholderia pseudomallei]
MSTTLEQSAFAPSAGASTSRMGHLDWLEAESIHILRELVAECSKPALLFSGGKDSVVVLHLALKAFGLGANRRTTLPFPLVHIDTGHNYDEVIDFRDRRAKQIGAELVVGHVEDSIARGTVVLRRETDSRNAAQAVTLLETIERHGYTAMIGGARRDEEKARAKERIFSFRDEFGQWDPKAQRPELWSLYNARLHRGEHLRVFPISNWTELDVWAYLNAFDVPVNPLHARGYPSIGCEPCTRAIRPGEDSRAGRWWWESRDTKECGLHITITPVPADGAESACA